VISGKQAVSQQSEIRKLIPFFGKIELALNRADQDRFRDLM
jgi:hypothetical protein